MDPGETQEDVDMAYLDTIDAFDHYSSYDESTIGSQQQQLAYDGDEEEDDAENVDMMDADDDDDDEECFIIDARDTRKVGCAMGYLNSMEDMSPADQLLAEYVSDVEGKLTLTLMRQKLEILERRQLRVAAQMIYYELLPKQLRMGLDLLLQQFEPWLEHDVVPIPRLEDEDERLVHYHWKLSGKYENVFPIEIHVRVNVPMNPDLPIEPPTWTLATPCLPVPPYLYKEVVDENDGKMYPQPLCQKTKTLADQVGWDGAQLLADYLDYILLPKSVMESFKELSEKMPWLADLYYHSKISWGLVGLNAGIYYEVRATFSLFTVEDVENRVMYYDSPVTTQMVRENHINYSVDPRWEILFQGRPRIRSPTPHDFDNFLEGIRHVPLDQRPPQWWRQYPEYIDMMTRLHSDITPPLHDAGYNYTRVADPKRKLSEDEYKRALGVFGHIEKMGDIEKKTLNVHTNPDSGVYHDVIQVYRRLCQLVFVCRDTDNPLGLDRETTITSDPRHENHKTRSRH